MYFAWLLEVGEAIGYKRAELFFKFPAVNETISHATNATGISPASGLRPADDSTFSYCRMLQKDRFHFSRSDRKAFVLDHLLAAIDD